MHKKPKPNHILDKLHKGFVYGCVGLTLYGTYLLGWRFYRYFTVIKPLKDEKDLIAKKSLLAEGSSDNLMDKAPQIQA